MLARRLLALLLVEFATYAWLAFELHGRGWHPVAILALVAFLHFVALRASVVLLGFAIAAAVGERPRPHLSWTARARLVLRECRAFWLNYALVPIEPWVQPESPIERVVLVHGILCNRAVWHGFKRRLARHGYRAHAVTLEPVLGDIDAMADDLAAQLRAAPGQVVIVAHSMGGLVTRRMLQRHPLAPVCGLVTIATPHAGSVQAALAFGQAGRSLRRTSAWLKALASGPAPHAELPRAALYSWHDELVSPPGSCRWEGAHECAWTGVGHIDLLWSGAVAAAVAQEIDAMTCPRPGAPAAALGTEATAVNSAAGAAP
jgi:pimeloyl-ACP methyl ester carboxylesterase